MTRPERTGMVVQGSFARLRGLDSVDAGLADVRMLFWFSGSPRRLRKSAWERNGR